MADSERLARAIDSIHAAGADEGRWPEALRAVARFTGSLAATLEVFGKAPLAMHEFRVSGLPPMAEIAYLNHYAQDNPRAGYAFSHLSQKILTDYQILDEPAMDRDPYYAKYLASIDLRYFVSGQIFNSAHEQAVVTIQRTRRQGHAGRDEINRLRALLPHFRLAHDMAVRLRDARAVGELVEQAIDWLADGVALLRSDGRVLHANAAMLALAGARDGIHLAGSGLELTGPREREQFAEALRVIGRWSRGDPTATASVDFAVQRPSGAPAYLVSVRPLAGGSGGNPKASGANLIVFVRDPLAHRAASAQALRTAFGLTEAEADLARALQEGSSPASYAHERLISPNTVYTHLRRIREKTRTKSIAELIHRLNGARLPLRGD